MKTIDEINIDIKEVAEELSQQFKGSKKTALKKKIVMLRQCRSYIESAPRPEFILEMKKDCKAKISSAEDHFFEWVKDSNNTVNCKNPKSKYNTLMQVSSLKAQLQTLNYLLK